MSELTPYIAVADACAAIEWYVEHLGAEVTYQPIVMRNGRAVAGGAVPDRVRGQPGRPRRGVPRSVRAPLFRATARLSRVRATR